MKERDTMTAPTVSPDETPRTDAYFKADNETDECISYANWVAFARTLERELREARAMIAASKPQEKP